MLRIVCVAALAAALGVFVPTLAPASEVTRSEPASWQVRPEPRPDEVPVLASQRLDADWLSRQPAATGGDHWRCLTEALYFEARGEKLAGQFAVAEVILNRVDSARFPSSVCGVVNQGTGRKWQCQFTYKCDGIPETVRDRASWQRLGKIARLALDGAPRDLTGGAMFYHTRAVSPSWSRAFFRTTTIGAHHFYSPEAQVASG
jgi:spore germination cell wall hydrolase CwlJ-like protein